jgi:beta-phosphoglucomutase-like phosphatase (HAD superfamily)
MEFQLKQVHVNRIKPYVENYGHIYVHGDGQMYIDEVINDPNGSSRKISKSAEHVKFHTSAPGDHRHEYVRKYEKGDKFPTSVKELIQDLYDANAKAAFKSNQPETAKNLHLAPAVDELVEDETVETKGKPGRKPNAV